MNGEMGLGAVGGGGEMGGSKKMRKARQRKESVVDVGEKVESAQRRMYLMG